ncbi:MAG TPA: hypothetical protein PLD34_06690 [Pseudothermotoga sp.]|nr:hypothetical protein [Pseudothermotoga sp.]
MKRLLYFVMVLCAVIPGCIANQPVNLLSELQIRYITIMYNYGPFRSIEEIQRLAEQSDYDDDVLQYYEYFSGQIALEQTKQIEKQAYNQRIKDYIKQNLPTNNSDNCLFIDNFDDPLPVQVSLNEKVSEKQNLLSDRIYRLLKRDWQNMGLFRVWHEDFYGNGISDEDLRKYATLLAQVSSSYCSTVIKRVQYTSSEFYRQYVDLSQIPAELLLAIAYKESRLFPASFRAEVYQDKIQAISLGLCHILVDADTLELDYPDIGNQTVDMRTFELVSYYYLGNDYAEKNLFDEMDLIQLRGNTLLSLIQLSLIFERLKTISGL